jgi:hypothetical protein
MRLPPGGRARGAQGQSVVLGRRQRLAVGFGEPRFGVREQQFGDILGAVVGGGGEREAA